MTPLASRMKENDQENARTCTQAPCYESSGSMRGARRLEVLKKATNDAAKRSQHSCEANHIVRRHTNRITFGHMQEHVQTSKQTNIDSSTHLQHCLGTTAAASLRQGGRLNAFFLQPSELLHLSSPCFEMSPKIYSFLCSSSHELVLAVSGTTFTAAALSWDCSRLFHTPT